MYERVQQRNGSSVVYFHAKVRLCEEANLDFWDTREQIITGLRSKQLGTMLLGKSHEDNDDILHDIQEFERIERERQAFSVYRVTAVRRVTKHTLRMRARFV
ncbi:hypothetical protein MTO96_044481 [Rhipicephalus appendiculatus]